MTDSALTLVDRWSKLEPRITRQIAKGGALVCALKEGQAIPMEEAALGLGLMTDELVSELCDAHTWMDEAVEILNSLASGEEVSS